MGCAATPDRFGMGVSRDLGQADFKGEADPWQDAYMEDSGVVVNAWVEWDLHSTDDNNEKLIAALYALNRIPLPKALRDKGIEPLPEPMPDEQTAGEKLLADATRLSADWRVWGTLGAILLFIILIRRKK